MSSFGSEFRAEAERCAGKVIRRTVGGWSFCLSYGAVDPREAVRGAKAANLRIEVNKKNVTKKVIEKLSSVSEEEIEAGKAALDKEWMLSAKLYPVGRPSKERDWEFLGKMIAAIGAPIDSIVTPIESTHPNETHYWVWRDS